MFCLTQHALHDYCNLYRHQYDVGGKSRDSPELTLGASVLRRPSVGIHSWCVACIGAASRLFCRAAEADPNDSCCALQRVCLSPDLDSCGR